MFVRPPNLSSCVLGCRRCVYVGNLSWSVTWQDLKDHFKTIGEVVHADVMMESATGRSKVRPSGLQRRTRRDDSHQVCCRWTGVGLQLISPSGRFLRQIRRGKSVRGEDYG